MSGYKKISMIHQQGSLGGVLQTFMHQFVDGILCALSPHHNVHRENGVYQQWTTYALKSKSVPEMHFPAIWRSKFTDLAKSKKTQSLGKNGCGQKCLDKSLIWTMLDASCNGTRLITQVPTLGDS